jgi:ribosome biogenesis GTPase
MEGVVLKSTGSFYQVASLEGNEVYQCRTKGKMRTLGKDTTNPVSVGDHVLFDKTGNLKEGLISEVLPRRNYIIRKSVNLSRQAQVIAANIDLALVVATPVLPRTSTGFIDRFLATAEAYSISAGVVFNKSDLYDHEVRAYVDELTGVYQAIGYKVFIVSALHPDTLYDLREAIAGRVTLFSGHSGTGKSTLINTLIPGLNLKTTSISTQHLKGKHTTTFAEMHPLPGGGYIIDTPGIREFGVLEFDKFEVSHFFPEIFREAKGCKYNNCLHQNEKDCAVIDAVEEGRIARSRYAGYLSILNNEDIYN